MLRGGELSFLDEVGVSYRDRTERVLGEEVLRVGDGVSRLVLFVSFVDFGLSRRLGVFFAIFFLNDSLQLQLLLLNQLKRARFLLLKHLHLLLHCLLLLISHVQLVNQALNLLLLLIHLLVFNQPHLLALTLQLREHLDLFPLLHYQFLLLLQCFKLVLIFQGFQFCYL